MSNQHIKKTNFRYFCAYLDEKIDAGVKQIDIAKYINKSAPYINKIYLKNQKSCPVDIQEKIAEYFNISLVELLRFGKNIIDNSVDENVVIVSAKKNSKSPDFIERRSLEPSDLIDQLNSVAVGIKTCENKLNKTKEIRNELVTLKNTVDIYLAIFDKLDEGVSFFNTKRELIFSSNRWGLLDGFNVSVNPSLDSMLLHLRNFINNLDEVIDLLDESYANTIETTIPVYLKNNKHFVFRVVPIYLEKKHKGWLLINKPATPPIAKLND